MVAYYFLCSRVGQLSVFSLKKIKFGPWPNKYKMWAIVAAFSKPPPPPPTQTPSLQILDFGSSETLEKVPQTLSLPQITAKSLHQLHISLAVFELRVN